MNRSQSFGKTKKYISSIVSEREFCCGFAWRFFLKDKAACFGKTPGDMAKSQVHWSQAQELPFKSPFARAFVELGITMRRIDWSWRLCHIILWRPNVNAKCTARYNPRKNSNSAAGVLQSTRGAYSKKKRLTCVFLPFKPFKFFRDKLFLPL